MVVAPLRLEAQSKGRSARPAFICPATAPARARDIPSLIFLCRGLRVMEVRIRATRQPRMIPITAPFEDVAVHIMQAPCIWWITAHFRRHAKRRPGLASVVWFAFEVCLFAAEFVAESSRCGSPRPARIFPLCFRGQPELPIFW